MQQIDHGGPFGRRTSLLSRRALSSRLLPSKARRARSVASYAALWPFKTRKSKTDMAKDEFLQLVLNSNPDQERLSELVDVLVSCPVKFNEASLGGGPWQVVYTRGPLLWQKLTNFGRVQSPRRGGNTAYQDFQPNQRAVLNYGELLGKSLHVTAEGTYTPLAARNSTPVEIEASVDRGALHAYGRKLPLPIKGKGFLTVAYIDNDTDCLRIFVNPQGNLSVQVKQSWLNSNLE